jgi:glycerol-3-phosphate acyltransferase PlsY
MVVGAAPPVAACGFSLFLVLLFTTRYMSLASLIAVSSSIVFGWILPGQARELVPLYVLLSVFVAIRHRPNIDRLRKGTEPRFSFKEGKADDSNLSEPRNSPADDEQAARESADGTPG